MCAITHAFNNERKGNTMFKAFLAFAVGAVLMALALSLYEVERRPEAVCVPLYDRHPLECWQPGPECPAPSDAR
jgi:hypothetical protein